MLVFGVWIDVPYDKIQYRALLGDSGETSGGHWCGDSLEQSFDPVVNGLGNMYSTRCAILPPNSTFLER
jgi:hypothetical protein